MLLKLKIVKQLIALLTLVLVAKVNAAIINVPGDAATIQAGIDLAVNGDDVVVADGTYSGPGNVNLNFNGKLIAVRSASGNPSLCIIDCFVDGRGFLFANGETNAATVNGFTIVNGDALSESGGAILIQASSPTIANCIFDSCSTDIDGGGIAVLNGEPDISNCLFIDCSASGFGGGLYVLSSDPVITDCTFRNNLASFGGGLYLRNSDSAVTDCIFESNRADNDGGAALSSQGTPSFFSCIVTENSTTQGNGGGLLLNASNALISNCTINNNFALGAFPLGGGGGLASENSSMPCIENCNFDGNTAEDRGGAMLTDSNADVFIDNCNFTNNISFRGGAILVIASAITVTESLFQSNSTTSGEGGAILTIDGDINVARSTFIDNHAVFRGGAINIFGSVGGSICDIIDCKFFNNSSDNTSGAINIFDTVSNITTITNSIFSGNSAVNEGGAILAFSEVDVTIDNCSFTNNTASSGGAINTFFFTPSVKIYNSIFWENMPDEIIGSASTIVRWCDIGGGLDASVIDGGGNIDEDPLFVDADGLDDIIGNEDDDLRLSAGTLCIDSGINSLVPIGITTDLDGNSRFIDDPATKDTGVGKPPIVDMGAYEFQAKSLCPWDLDMSGSVGTSDLLTLLAQWGTAGSADFDGSGEVGTADLLVLLANWGTCP